MHLTREEELIYKGERGPAREWAMKFMVKYGEAMDAERLIPIESAFITWTYWLEDKLPQEILRDIFETKMAVPTFTNVLPDIQHRTEYGLTNEQVEKQKRFEKAAKNIDVILTGTCAPYESGWVPMPKTHVASGESSLINFVNSYFNARTLREGYPSKWAAALTGKAPYADLHTDEGRKGNLLVRLDVGLMEITDYDALGYYVGDIPYDVPVFMKMPGNMRIEQFKQLGASLATSGSVGMYHIVGLTAEAPTIEAAFQGDNPEEEITVGSDEIKEVYERLSTHGMNRVDHVILGCPHNTLRQLIETCGMLRGRKVNRKTKLWILVAPATHSVAVRMGLERDIKIAGASLLTGCFGLGEGLTFTRGTILATNSAKCAHYAKSCSPGIDVWFGTTKQCIDSAINGRWRF